MGRGAVEVVADGIVAPLPIWEQLRYLDKSDYEAKTKSGNWHLNNS